MGFVAGSFLVRMSDTQVESATVFCNSALLPRWRSISSISM